MVVLKAGSRRVVIKHAKPLRDDRGRLLPGQTANPNGRPKYKTLSETYAEYLGKVCPYDPQRRTYRECIANRMVDEANGGKLSLRAAMELVDRLEGRPFQKIQIIKQEEPSYNLDALSDEELEQWHSLLSKVNKGS